MTINEIRDSLVNKLDPTAMIEKFGQEKAEFMVAAMIEAINTFAKSEEAINKHRYEGDDGVSLAMRLHAAEAARKIA